MTAEEAALIMMSGGGNSPVTPSPLSLEGIKSLKTLAAMTVGDFVFEFKEPQIFYAGSLVLTSDGATLNSNWIASEVINNSIAVVADGGAYEYYSWGNYTDNNGNPHSTYFNSCSDFAVTAVNPSISSRGLPSISIDFSYKYSGGYDSVPDFTQTNSMGTHLSGTSASDVKFTNLTADEYFKFIKSYCAAAAVNTPVIEIF